MHLRSLHASADFSNRSKEKSHKRASYVFASGGHRSRTSVRGQGLFHLVDVDAHTKGLGRLSFSNIRAKSHHPSRVRMAQESSRSARGVSRRPCLFSLSKGWRKAAGVSADDTIGRTPAGGSTAVCRRAGVTECHTDSRDSSSQSPYKMRPFLLCLPFLLFPPSDLHGTGIRQRQTVNCLDQFHTSVGRHRVSSSSNFKMGFSRQGRGAARLNSVNKYSRGRRAKSVKDAGNVGEEQDKFHGKASRQKKAGRGFCELYLGSTEGGLCIGSGTGEYHFLVPVTEVLAVTAAEHQATALHLSGVLFRMDLFRQAEVDFFATLVKVPAADLQSIEVNAKNRVFQLGASATETPEGARPRAMGDPTVARIAKHACNGYAVDGSLFNAPMKLGLPPVKSAEVNGYTKHSYRGRFGTSLNGSGDGGVSHVTGEVKDSIRVYWKPSEDLTVRDGPGNVVVDDRYVILVGVRPLGASLVDDEDPNSRRVAHVNWVTVEYYGHF